MIDVPTAISSTIRRPAIVLLNRVEDADFANRRAHSSHSVGVIRRTSLLSSAGQLFSDAAKTCSPLARILTNSGARARSFPQRRDEPAAARGAGSRYCRAGKIV